MQSQYLSTVMSVDDFSQWDFFHIKTRSSDGRKPENLQLVTQSTGKKERKDFFFFANGCGYNYCVFLFCKNIL